MSSLSIEDSLLQKYSFQISFENGRYSFVKDCENLKQDSDYFQYWRETLFFNLSSSVLVDIRRLGQCLFSLGLLCLGVIVNIYGEFEGFQNQASIKFNIEEETCIKSARGVLI